MGTSGDEKCARYSSQVMTQKTSALYGLGSPRFTDILPGQACQKSGHVATKMSDILEIYDGRIRFFYISKNELQFRKARISNPFC